jgi:hypothetical protein
MIGETGGRGRRRVFRLPWRTARHIQLDLDEEIAFHCEMRLAELVAQGLRAIGLNPGSAECCRLSASLMAFGCGSALGFRPGYPSSARLSVGEQPSRSG